MRGRSAGRIEGPPFVETARTKIEFSSVNANLMVAAGHRPILSAWATIELWRLFLPQIQNG
jgi:hypothetical protein